MEELPNELLVSILFFLDSLSLSNICLVCRSFKAASETEALWEIHCLRHKNNGAYYNNGNELQIMRRKKEQLWRDYFIELENFQIVKTGILCRGLYDFTASQPSELSFKEGDLIFCLPTESENLGWFLGYLDGNTGWIPSEFCMVERENYPWLMTKSKVKEARKTTHHRPILVGRTLNPFICSQFILFAEQKGFSPGLQHNKILAYSSEKISKTLWDVKINFPIIFTENKIWEPVRINPRLRFFKYSIGDSTNFHTDGPFLDAQLKSLLSLVTYLNQNFEGGETIFKIDSDREEIFQPKTGQILIFPHTVLHKSSEVTKGTKYVLRTDVLYKISESDVIDRTIDLYL